MSAALNRGRRPASSRKKELKAPQLMKVFGNLGGMNSVVQLHPEISVSGLGNLENLQSRMWEEVAHSQQQLDQSTFFARFKNNRLAYYSAWLLVGWTLFSLLVLWLMPKAYREINQELKYLPPNFSHWMGCDTMGQDYMYKLTKGYMISIMAASAPTILGLFMGACVGIFAALKGGITDFFILGWAEVLGSLDEYFIVVVVASYFKLTLWQFNFVYCLIYWVLDAQSVRGACLDVLGKDYIENARLLGMSDFELARRHVVPHLFSILSNLYLSKLSSFMRKEVFFIYLGIRMDLMEDSIGKLMIVPYSGESHYFKTWVIWLPGTVYMAMNMAISFVADAISDAKNMKNFRA